MNTKNNLRYQDSEQKIKDSVMNLLNDKTLDQLTVQDICKASGINRSTFYAHYEDIPDLLDKLYQAGFTFVLKRWVDHDCKESPETIAKYLRNCLGSFINCH